MDTIDSRNWRLLGLDEEMEISKFYADPEVYEWVRGQIEARHGVEFQRVLPQE
jgi:hypothetical protein